MNSQNVRSLLDFLGRVLTVAVTYTATFIVVGTGLTVFGFEDRGDGLLLLWTFIGSFLIALALGLAAETIPASRSRHLLIWTTLLFGNHAALIIGNAILNPDSAHSVPALLLQQFLACIVSADVIYYFFAPAPHTTLESVRHHWLGWLGRFAAAALAYIVFFYAFGAINYSLVTQPYYTASLNGLTIPEAQAVLLVQFVRAPIIILSLLPLLFTMRALPYQILITAGMLLFVSNGVMTLLGQIGQLPADLFLATGFELFAQNFGTGAVAAWLLGAFTTRHEPTPHLKGLTR